MNASQPGVLGVCVCRCNELLARVFEDIEGSGENVFLKDPVQFYYQRHTQLSLILFWIPLSKELITITFQFHQVLGTFKEKCLQMKC